jgi:hypothetical protein
MTCHHQILEPPARLVAAGDLPHASEESVVANQHHGEGAVKLSTFEDSGSVKVIVATLLRYGFGLLWLTSVL